MFRKFVFSLAIVSLAAWCAMTVACGSSGNKTTSCTGGPYNVVGDWEITVTSTGSQVTGYGAIDSTGLALFFDNSPTTGTGDTLQMPTITGACSFSGNIVDYEEPGGPFTGQTVSDTATGNVTSATAISGSFNGTGNSGTFTASPFSPLTGSLAAVTGTKTGIAEGTLNNQSVLLPSTFTASGTGASMSFTTGDTNLNCTTSGTFTQVGTANVFDVSITFTSTGAGGCPVTGTLNGIGFESSSDYFGLNGHGADTYLYADVQASTNTYVVIEFF